MTASLYRDSSPPAPRPRGLDSATAAKLDSFIDNARTKLAVPGAAIAVLANDAVVYERSAGVRALGSSATVSPHTLFLMGSVTKPMTTLMQAALVDRGSFGWDTPVVKLLPAFALGDAAITQRVALWHTSCACTGMPRQDLENIFEFEGVTAEERIASMRTMTPTTGFGETYQYSNLMVAAGGYAAAHAVYPQLTLAEAYDRALREVVLDPIGMRTTTFDFATVAREDHAMPHALAIDGETRLLPLAYERDVLPIQPAGGAWSNLRDMERLVQTEIARGIAPDGRRVVSEANLMTRWNERVRSPHGGYGLGLALGNYHGLRAVSHDGGTFGFGTTMFVLPDQRVGIIILTNVRNGDARAQLPFNEVVQTRILELLFDDPHPVAATALSEAVERRNDLISHALTALELTPGAAWLSRLAGTYRHPALGTVTVTGAIFDVGEWRTTIGRRSDPSGSEKAVVLDPPFAGTELLVGGDDTRRTLTIPYGPFAYTLERDPAKSK